MKEEMKDFICYFICYSYVANKNLCCVFIKRYEVGCKILTL